MITASHNPPEYNGLKPIATDGVEVPREDELKIENLYRKKNFVKLSDYGVARNVYLNSFYLQEVLRLLDADKIRARKFKVVMDLGNGVQGYVSPVLCGKLGCKVIPVNGVLDGNFPGRGSEPTPDNLLELGSLVREVGADFGVAYDGDGDRSIFCDDKGVIYTGDRSGALLIRHLLSERHLKTDIVCPGNTSIVVSKIAKELGSKVVYTKVGSVEVSREMIKKKALIGLEENGGFMYGPLNEVRDGAMTTALLLEMLASNKNSLSDLLASLPVLHQYKTKFHSSNKSILRVIIKECINHGNPTKVETLDGAKIWIDDETWIMIRPSGTEPLIRMYAESTDKDLIDSKVREYTALINKVIGQNIS
jgi:phosphomannomutase/phosphoglucomutase